jgi:endoglucanase
MDDVSGGGGMEFGIMCNAGARQTRGPRRLAPVIAVALLAGAASGTVQAQTDLLPHGPLSTRGRQIVGADGQSVRILGVGVFTNISTRVDAVVAAGFNTLRVEWGNRESELRLQEVDQIVAAARRVGLKVILDDHYNEGVRSPCSAQQANGLWYDLGGASDGTDGCHTPGTVTDAKFVEDWHRVARRYAGNDTVIGYDLWNEPLAYGPAMSSWQAGDQNPEHNIRYMYERVGNTILAIDPQKLIICEGPQDQHSFADGRLPAPWGDLSVAGKYPVTLSVPAKVVYSVHDYPTEIGGFSPDSGPRKVALMTAAWGYLVASDIAPVWIGEMGANMTTEADAAWAHTLIEYANGQSDAPGAPHFAAGEQGIGVSWWWAGYDSHSGSQPSGIFNAQGSLNLQQQHVYRQFSSQPVRAVRRTPE